MKNKKGFSLVELLLVIVIIAIISLLVMPSINDILKVNKNKKYTTIEDLVKTNLELYYIDHKEEIADGTTIKFFLNDDYDINGDGLVNMDDIMFVANCVNDSSMCNDKCDLDGEEGVTFEDSVKILRIISKTGTGVVYKNYGDVDMDICSNKYLAIIKNGDSVNYQVRIQCKENDDDEGAEAVYDSATDGGKYCDTDACKKS